MVHTTAFTFLTSEYNQYIVITDKVRQAVHECGVRDGMVTVLSKHTTAGIMTNESLECLESDIDVFLKGLVPEDHPYSHGAPGKHKVNILAVVHVRQMAAVPFCYEQRLAVHIVAGAHGAVDAAGNKRTGFFE